MNALSHARFDVLGVPVSELDLPRAVEIVEAWGRDGTKAFVCVTGVHGVIECQDDPELLAIHRRASMVTPDGMPLVWWANRHGLKTVRRVYGPDLMAAVCARAPRNGLRHFFYGGGEGVAQDLARAMRARTPELQVVGTYQPPFRPLEDHEMDDVAGLINAARPDIVWVGLGTPKQERWMDAFRERLDASVLVGVGAAFDFLAGRQRQAPAWLQRHGLEWAYRLVREPRRLAGRYGRIVPRFLLLALAEGAGRPRGAAEKGANRL